MLGLLYKDFCIISKQLGLFLFFVIIFSFSPVSSVQYTYLGLVYTLPLTALAYDERSKWLNLAVTMPFRRRTLVLAKYLIGYLTAFGFIILLFLGNAVVMAVRHQPFEWSYFWTIGLISLAGTILMIFTLPPSFLYGTEKGRLAIIALVVLILGFLFFFQSMKTPLKGLAQIDFYAVIPWFILVILFLNALSIFVSIKIYERKEF